MDKRYATVTRNLSRENATAGAVRFDFRIGKDRSEYTAAETVIRNRVLFSRVSLLSAVVVVSFSINPSLYVPFRFSSLSLNLSYFSRSLHGVSAQTNARPKFVHYKHVVVFKKDSG